MSRSDLPGHASELAAQIRASSFGMLTAALEAALLQAFEKVAERAWYEGHRQSRFDLSSNPYRQEAGDGAWLEWRRLPFTAAHDDMTLVVPDGYELLINGLAVGSPARARKGDVYECRPARPATSPQYLAAAVANGSGVVVPPGWELLVNGVPVTGGTQIKAGDELAVRRPPEDSSG